MQRVPRIRRYFRNADERTLYGIHVSFEHNCIPVSLFPTLSGNAFEFKARFIGSNHSGFGSVAAASSQNFERLLRAGGVGGLCQDRGLGRRAAA